jgi:phage shock protein C
MSAKYKQLYRSRDDRMIAGVCGGMGDYFDLDPTIIRLIFVFGSVVTGSGLFWAYLVMMLIVPEEPLASQAVVDAPVEESTEVEDIPESD